MEQEPSEKELRDIQRQLDNENLFDEDYDNFQIMEEDFNYNEEDDW